MTITQPLFQLPFAGTTLSFEVPWGADLAISPTLSPRTRHPLAIPPIERGDYQRVMICFTDATRHSPDQWFCEALLPQLPFPQDAIHFLCATGMHRPSTHDEKIAKLGAEIVARYAVTDHDPAQVVKIGEIDGIPVDVNQMLVEPGTMVICLGVVEPHQYAGFSGGVKTAVIGCGGVNTIAQTHGPAMLDQPGVRLGVIEGNPFQDFLRQAGQLIGVDAILNAVTDHDGKPIHTAFGDVSVYDDLVAVARQQVEVCVPNVPYDVVIAGVASPKDVNLYQASRAATYIGLSHAPILRPGGVIILPAWLPEGAGDGVGEQNFFAALTRRRPDQLIAHLRVVGCQPGEQRAYMVAQLLSQYHVIVVGGRNPALVRVAGLRYAATMDHALGLAQQMTASGSPKTLVVPDAIHMLPTVCAV